MCVGAEPAFGGQPGIALAERRRVRARGAGRSRRARSTDRRAGRAAHDRRRRRCRARRATPAAARPPPPAPWPAPSAPPHASRRRSSPRRARHARRCRTGCGRSGRRRPAPGGNRRPSVSAQICAIAVAKPWPTDEPPVTSSTAPVVSTRDAGAVERPEPALLDKDRDARRRPARRRRGGGAAPPAAPPSRSAPAPCRAAARSRRNRRRPRCRARCSGRLNGISAAVIRLRRRTVDPVEAEPVGDRVEQPLAHEGALVASGRAIGRGRRLVGQPEMADAR